MNIQVTSPPTIDLTMIKERQQIAWGSGDYAIIGTTLQIVGEMLCEAVDLRSNQRVLDVAAGNGNASLAAARRFADVVSTDYVGSLLERGRERAEAERLPIAFQEADAENLPFPDASFDVVLSTFGVMFTPNQDQAARELLRVCRLEGKIGLANWTPESFIGQLFKTMSPYLPKPPVGASPPPLWGDRDHVRALFAATGVELEFASQAASFHGDSPEAFVEFMADHYGPVLKARDRLAAEGRWDALRADLVALCERANVAEDGFLAPSEYLLALGRKQR